MKVGSLKPPFNRKECFFIINEFQIEFPLSTVQPILNLLSERKYKTVNENANIQDVITKAAENYESLRQKMLNEMLLQLLKKRSCSKPVSNLELLERMLEKTRTKCLEFLSTRLTENLTRKYFHMLLPPKNRRNKKSTNQQARKKTKRRKKQKEKKKTGLAKKRSMCLPNRINN